MTPHEKILPQGFTERYRCFELLSLRIVQFRIVVMEGWQLQFMSGTASAPGKRKELLR
jgi:hypothetical protein